MTPMWVPLLVAALAALATMLARAAAIDPPSEFLFKASHTVVAGEVLRTTHDGGLDLRVNETLHGAPPDAADLRVRAPVEWLEGFKSGQRVLVAYTLHRRSAMRPKALELRPDGAVLLVSAGLEPALFHDTPATRALVEMRPDVSRVQTRAWLDATIAGLQSQDPQLQNFHAAELALRMPLHGLLRNPDRAAIARFVGSDAAYPSARTALLTIAAQHPVHFGEAWPADVALDVIATTSVSQSDTALSLLPNLVRKAFDVLALTDRRIPLASATRWLSSTQIGLVETALLAIRRQAPERERELIEQTLARPDLIATSREFLNDHLRRLGIMQAALAASRANHERHD